jgi:hypothetical protein
MAQNDKKIEISEATKRDVAELTQISKTWKNYIDSQDDYVIGIFFGIALSLIGNGLIGSFFSLYSFSHEALRLIFDFFFIMFLISITSFSYLQYRKFKRKFEREVPPVLEKLAKLSMDLRKDGEKAGVEDNKRL